MLWVTRKPRMRVALADSMPIYRTDAGRDLAQAYLELLGAAGGKLPAKSQLDVTQLARAIPHLALCSIIKPDKCVFRVAGEEVKRRIGTNPVGLNYYDFVPAERRDHAIRAMHMAIDVPCAFRAEIEQTYTTGLRRLVEATGFPLRSEQPGIDGFILFADCQIGEIAGATPAKTLLLGANVTRRDLIDLGFGVDEEFEDMVPAG